MTSRNVEIYRAGHEAFNQRDFEAMTKEYADNITWTDHAQGRTFTAVGTHDGPFGPFPATGKEFALPLCEMWHFDSNGQIVGGDLYYDQVSLLTQLDLMPQPSGA